jgi:Zn finger protein HypA/HybF involved in hydrogenase expression
MNVFTFGVHFTDEQSCRLHFKQERDKIGVVCNRCKGTEHYWLQNKWSYECKSCRSRRIGLPSLFVTNFLRSPCS